MGQSSSAAARHQFKATLCAWLAAAIAAVSAHAETVGYTLDNVVLLDGRQISGAFDWTYANGDFDDGSGEFTALEIPWRPGGSLPPLDDPNMVLTIENNQIEISLDGNFHDYGLDVGLKFAVPLSATQPSPLDLATSFFECCGNGFHDQPLVSGSIVPVDRDGDGVADAADNCLAVANAGQRDTDGDGFGNRCDADFNNDCVVNAVDLGILKIDFFAAGTDTDLDGDGVVNAIDLGVLKGLFFAAPGPSGIASCANALADLAGALRDAQYSAWFGDGFDDLGACCSQDRNGLT